MPFYLKMFIYIDIGNSDHIKRNEYQIGSGRYNLVCMVQLKYLYDRDNIAYWVDKKLKYEEKHSEIIHLIATMHIKI